MTILLFFLIIEYPLLRVESIDDDDNNLDKLIKEFIFSFFIPSINNSNLLDKFLNNIFLFFSS